MAVLAALARVVNGRIGAAVGATYDATGRLLDLRNDVTRLVRLLLAIEDDGSDAERSAMVEAALLDLAHATDVSSVAELIDARLGPILARATEGYPDALWQPTCAAQVRRRASSTSL